MASDRTFNILTQLSINDAEFKAGLNRVKSSSRELMNNLMTGAKGATGNINEMQRALGALKNVSFAGKSLEEINAIKTRIKELTADIQKFNTETRGAGASAKTGFGGIAGMLKGALPIAGIAAGITAAVSGVVNFTKELVALSGEVAGVEEAFNRVSSETDLSNLRASVKGTVSDLELMKNAVQASNFGIPIQEMGNLLAFAAKRAQDTGQSVDYLVNSIVTGIGRKSPLILDNLGISAVQLKEKLKGVEVGSASVAEVTKAVGEIARESLNITGELTETSKTRAEQSKASWANVKLELATVLEPAISRATTILASFVGKLAEWARNLDDWFNQIHDWFADFYNQSMLLRAAIEYVGVQFTVFFQILKVNFQTLFNYLATAAKLIKAVFTGNFSDIPGIIRDSVEKQKDIFVESGRKIGGAIKGAIEDTMNNRMEFKIKPEITVEPTYIFTNAPKPKEIEDMFGSWLPKVTPLVTVEPKIKVDETKITTKTTTKTTTKAPETQFEKDNKSLSALMKQMEDYAAKGVEIPKSIIEEYIKLQEKIKEVGETIRTNLIDVKYNVKAGPIAEIQKSLTTKPVVRTSEQLEYDKKEGKTKQGLLDMGIINQEQAKFKEPLVGVADWYKKNAEDIKAATEANNKYLEDMSNKAILYGEAVAGAFDKFGTSIIEGLGLAENGLEGFAKMMLQTVLQLISQMLAAAIAGAIKNATLAATFLGPAGLFAQPAFIATAIGGVLSAFAAIPKFATGGIVPGSSYTGDYMPVMANSGEMILNKGQQANLFSMLNNGVGGSGREVVFRIDGTQLVGVLNNHSRKINAIR